MYNINKEWTIKEKHIIVEDAAHILCKYFYSGL